jgi:antitoxin MazE
MKANIVQIGNSKGVRIPKTIIEQLKFEKTVEFEVLPEGLLLRPVKNQTEKVAPRADWEEIIQAALAKETDDAADFGEWNHNALTEFDENEW